MFAAQTQAAPRDRLVLLCREYGADSQTVLVPLTRAELADRWGVSRGTVQRFLTRRMASGEVIATAPLTLNAAAIIGTERPQLQLLVNRTTSEPPDDSPGGAGAVRSNSPGVDPWLKSIREALIAAAEAGCTETALALEARLYERLARQDPPGAGQPKGPRDRGARVEGLLRDQRATSSTILVARSSSEEELEGIIPSNSNDADAARPVAQISRADIAHDAQEALRSAEAPEDVVAVVVRRLTNAELRSTGATPAWMRSPAWQAPVWSQEDVADLQGCWIEAFDCPLAGDPLLALQLWPPAQAKEAVAILAGDSNVRSPLGRILEAAVWGYHKHFPPRFATHDNWMVGANRLWELNEAEAWFAGNPDLVIEHLRTLAEHPNRNEEELLDILGIHLLKGSLTVAELEALDCHCWTSAEIAAAADRVERALAGDRS